MFRDLLALVIGQNAADTLRDSKRSRDLLPQERTDAYSGAASAVLGSFGLLIGVLATRGALLADSGRNFAALAIIAVLGLGCSYSGYYFGRRAPRVTRRFLGLARYAVVTAVAGAAFAVASLVLIAVRNLH